MSAHGALLEDFNTHWMFQGEVLARCSKNEVRKATRVREGSSTAAVSASSLRSPRTSGACVVLKMFTASMPQHKIQKELAMLAAVQGHANIVELHGLFIVEDQNASWSIAQMWCSGGDLFAQIIASPYNELEAMSCIVEISDALKYVHKRGIVHRDVKAEHIFLHKGKCILGDFGSAICEQDRESMSQPQGTVGYIAPEVLMRLYQICSFPVDMFSLGVVFYFLLSAIMPFGNGRDKERTCKATCRMSIKFDNDVFTEVSRSTKMMIRKMCSPSALRPSARSAHHWSGRSLRELNAARDLANIVSPEDFPDKTHQSMEPAVQDEGEIEGEPEAEETASPLHAHKTRLQSQTSTQGDLSPSFKRCISSACDTVSTCIERDLNDHADSLHQGLSSTGACSSLPLFVKAGDEKAAVEAASPTSRHEAAVTTGGAPSGGLIPTAPDSPKPSRARPVRLSLDFPHAARSPEPRRKFDTR
eukprot:TRINITY_DN23445_c0_g1_i1.p1 TRINITY_DN23445_c0_g1~~TRINITY_DN23445_c0_g1_i1.p1  ORF type:complete len:474 (+),score=44.43 TRINITY_DN23445_c0_g1_i1:494-1915(+)